MTKNHFLVLLIVIGLIGGLTSFIYRYQTEARNRRVELVIDYTDAQLLANTKSQSLDDVLPQLRGAGITTVAITEDTPYTLWQNGVLNQHRDGDTTLLTFAPGFPGQRDRVMQMLQHKTGLRVTAEGTSDLRVSASWPQFNVTPIGLDNTTVQTVLRNGLRVTPRLQNYTGVTADSIAWEMAQVQTQCTPGSIGPLIFAGAAALGNRGLLNDTANALAADNLVYGTVEFSKMTGDDILTREASAQTVRVHSIGADEMLTMDEPTAIERFVRAARERNIRVCYVRLFTSGLEKNSDVIGANVEFVQSVVKGLTEAQFTIGAAHPYDRDPKPPLILRVLMGIGVMGGALLLLRIFTGINGRAYLIAVALGLILAVGLALPGQTPKGREILALLSACVFPALSLCYVPLTWDTGSEEKKTGVIAQAFAEYARITLGTLAGIVLVVGLLSGRLFLLKVDEFLGVKLVLVTPIVLVWAYYGLGLAALGPDADWKTRWERVLSIVRRVASEPLLVGQVVLALAALVILAIIVTRSGNDSAVSVSPLELKVRSLLDKYLGVRPRTKEFLLGHPALFFALAAAAARRYRKWLLPLLVVGSIGQSSLMDTFCHLHTPLNISMGHAVIGWILGGIIGAFVYWLVARNEKKTTFRDSQREKMTVGASA